MAVTPSRYQICLSIPVGARKQLLSYSKIIQDTEGSLQVPNLDEFCVRIMSVEAQSGDDIEKIERAVAEIKIAFQGQDVTVHTAAPCVCRHYTVLAFNVQSSGLAGQAAGYFKRLFSVLYGSLLEQGVLAAQVVPQEENSPYVILARVRSQQSTFTSDAAKLVPRESFVQWQTTLDGLFVKQEVR